VLHKLYYANAERLIFARKVAVAVVDPLDEPPASSTPAPGRWPPIACRER
jgi:hypothetical protein